LLSITPLPYTSPNRSSNDNGIDEFLKYLANSKPQCLGLSPPSPSSSSTGLGMRQELDDSGERLQSKEGEAALPKGNRF
jgi:hypothetical protein